VNDSVTDEDDRYQIMAASSLTLSGARVLKHGDTFAVFDRHGDIRPYGIAGAQGLYHEGTRFLSALRVRLGGERPLLLSSTVREDNILLGVDLMNPDLTPEGQALIQHGTIHVLRSKFLWRGSCYEYLQISNYGSTAVDVALAVEFAADFVDVFEVRGTRRERRGTLHPPEVSENAVTLSYTGLDGDRRCTRLHFAPAPDICSEKHVSFQLHLEAAQSKDVYVTVSCESWTERPSSHRAFEHAHVEACSALRRHAGVECSIHTSNEQFNDWLNRSIADLRMMITDTPHGPFPYAGVPWFSAPFGRDAIITALMALWFNPELALGVLSFLAATQADAFDAEADAEPGKIVHEMRSGEMASLREIPFGRYYGSVDPITRSAAIPRASSGCGRTSSARSSGSLVTAISMATVSWNTDAAREAGCFTKAGKTRTIPYFMPMARRRRDRSRCVKSRATSTPPSRAPAGWPRCSACRSEPRR
jgi:glycogen debranching enzyme